MWTACAGMNRMGKGQGMIIDRKHIDREVLAQKAIVSGLKREIFGADKTSSSNYISEFHAEFNSFRRTSSIEEIVKKALASDIVYFGDYHPLDASQEWVLFLVKTLKEQGARVVLALEMLYEYQQESLDRWMKGAYSESEFLDVIDYESEWGFNWESYKRLFKTAKDPFVPIFGIDYEPRDHLRYIKLRDRMMARKISSIRDFFPGYIILTVVGESHLASRHLPREVRRECGKDIRELVIVQNMDELYWKLMRKGCEDTCALMIDRNRYCIFTTSPILKYQSYRDIIEFWSDQPVSEAVLASLREMVDNILGMLLDGSGTFEVTVGEDWTESVENVFPEVNCQRTYKSVTTLLRSKKISHKALLAVKENLKKTGFSYFPAHNIFLMLRFDQAGAAVEAGRFVVYAMRGEIGLSRRIQRSEEDRFYAYVFEEALAWTGARIINPRLDISVMDDLLSRIDDRGVVTGKLDGYSLEHTREIVSLLKYHFKREKKSRNGFRTTTRLRELYRLVIRKRLFIIRTLGRTLGDALYKGYHEGKIRRKELAGLFRETFVEPGTGKKLYMKWVRKTRPFRGGWSSKQ